MTVANLSSSTRNKNVIDPSSGGRHTIIARTNAYTMETPTKMTFVNNPNKASPMVDKLTTMQTPETMSTISSSCIDPSSWSATITAASNSSNSTLASPCDSEMTEEETEADKVLFKCLLPPGGIESLPQKESIPSGTSGAGMGGTSTWEKECISQSLPYSPPIAVAAATNYETMTSPESWSTITLSHKDSFSSMPLHDIVRTQSLLDFDEDDDDDEDDEDDHDHDTVLAHNTTSNSMLSQSSQHDNSILLDTSLPPIDDELLKSMIQSAQYTLSEECTSVELQNLTRQMSQLELHTTTTTTSKREDEEDEWEEELQQLNQSTKDFQKELDFAMDQVAYRHDSTSYFSCLMDPPPHEALACGGHDEDEENEDGCKKGLEEASLMDRMLCCQDDFCSGASSGAAADNDTKHLAGVLPVSSNGENKKEDLNVLLEGGENGSSSIRPVDPITGNTIPQGLPVVPVLGPSLVE